MKIRKGKDIGIRWSILTNGEAVSLEGRDLTLFVRSTMGVMLHDFEVEGNTLLFKFRASEQKALGPYTLTLYVNHGKDGQTVVDKCNAFTLVSTTCQEGDDKCDCNNLEVTTIDLGTDSINVGLAGPKGNDGFSPIIEVYDENTDDDYRLKITTAGGVIITPNLYGGGYLKECTEEDIDNLF